MTSTTGAAPLQGEELKAAWLRIKEGKGFIPLKIGADTLGVPEAVLQNVLQGPGIVRLRSEFVPLLESVRQLGKIMGNLRNGHFVALPVGEFSELSFEGDIARARGGAIDVSFNLARWSSAFGVTEESRGALRRNLCFFDDCGDAAYKVILWSKEADDIFDKLVEKFKGNSDEKVVTSGSNHEDWSSTEKYQDLQSISDDAPKRTESLFRACIEQEINVEWYIPTRAAAQTYRGPLRTMEARKDLEGWFDILYPHFMTHMGVAEVARCVIAPSETSQSQSVVMIGGNDRVICVLGLGSDNRPAAKDAWAEAVTSGVIG